MIQHHFLSAKSDKLFSVKKMQCSFRGYTTHEYELSNQLNTTYNSFALVCILQAGAFCIFSKVFLRNFPKSTSNFNFYGLRVYERGHQKKSPAFAAAKGGENMNEPNRTQWQIRCAFNGFCKRALKNEAMNAHRDTKQRQLREVTFSDLPPEEENRLYVCDEYFADDEAEKSFVIGGKEITAKLLSEALHSLSDEKRETVLLYYFFDMSEREIATYCNIPRTTVQTRRTSSMKLLKRYLEEHAYDYKG